MPTRSPTDSKVPHYCGPMLTNQFTPNLSVNMPKIAPQGAASNGTAIVAPSVSLSQ